MFYTDFSNMPPYTEINMPYFEKPTIQNKARRVIHEWIQKLSTEKGYWTNNLLKLQDGLWHESENTVYEWQDCDSIFNIHFFSDGDVLYFKLLPVDTPYRQTLSNNFDGFFGKYTGNKEVLDIYAELDAIGELEYVDEDMYMHVIYK